MFDKNKIIHKKQYHRCQGHIVISPCFELGSIHCELKMDRQSLQAGESWWHNSMVSGTKAKTKPRYIWIEKYDSKTGSRLKARLKNSRNICDQLPNVHHTHN